MICCAIILYRSECHVNLIPLWQGSANTQARDAFRRVHKYYAVLAFLRLLRAKAKLLAAFFCAIS